MTVRRRSLATALAFGVLLACPAHASSITSDSFVAILEPTTDFLDASSRIAETKAVSARVRGFARTEIHEQGRARIALADWHVAEQRREARNAAEPTVDRVGPLANLVVAPFDTLAAATSRITPPFTQLPSADRLKAVDQADLARTGALEGREFDTLFVAQQIDRLVLLERTYEDFIKNGDDPDLRALAVHHLPTIKGLLASAKRL